MIGNIGINPPQNVNAGYWVEPFVDIIEGKKQLTYVELSFCTDVLYKHRFEGNPNFSKKLQTLEGRLKAINELWQIMPIKQKSMG